MRVHSARSRDSAELYGRSVARCAALEACLRSEAQHLLQKFFGGHWLGCGVGGTVLAVSIIRAVIGPMRTLRT
jgi:hypothetical protein